MIDQLNYQAVVLRGKIKAKTKMIVFAFKLLEEVYEVFKAIIKRDNDNLNEELGDVIVTATNALIHNGAKPTVIKHKIYVKNKGRV